MKRLSLVFAALAASLTIPAVASANGGGGTPPPVCPQWSRHTRQAVLFSTPPRIAAVATIGMSRPKLTASAGVPDYCT